jgi:Cu+-exporting ATPase
VRPAQRGSSGAVTPAGIESAQVNLATEKATLRAHQPIDLDRAAAAITQAGYDVPQETLEFSIGGMTCASCVGRVEQAIGKLPGVQKVTVNLATERANVQAYAGTVTAAQVIAAVQGAGDEAATASATSPAVVRSGGHEGAHVIVAAILTLPLVLPMLAELAGRHWMLPAWFQFLLATPVQFYLGARFYRAGWKAVMARAGNMDLLVALGTSAAYGLSLYQVVECRRRRDAASLFRSRGCRHHAGAAGQMAGGARQAPNYRGNPRVAGTAARARPRAARRCGYRVADGVGPARRPGGGTPRRTGGGGW